MIGNYFSLPYIPSKEGKKGIKFNMQRKKVVILGGGTRNLGCFKRTKILSH